MRYSFYCCDLLLLYHFILKAIAAFLEATEAEPKQPTLCALGDLYAKLGKFDDAINIYDSALKLSPENTEM